MYLAAEFLTVQGDNRVQLAAGSQDIHLRHIIHRRRHADHDIVEVEVLRTAKVLKGVVHPVGRCRHLGNHGIGLRWVNIASLINSGTAVLAVVNSNSI